MEKMVRCSNYEGCSSGSCVHKIEHTYRANCATKHSNLNLCTVRDICKPITTEKWAEYKLAEMKRWEECTKEFHWSTNKDKEEKAMEYKIKEGLTIGQIAEAVKRTKSSCPEAAKLFGEFMLFRFEIGMDLLKESAVSSKRNLDWLKSDSNALIWAVEEGFVEEVGRGIPKLTVVEEDERFVVRSFEAVGYILNINKSTGKLYLYKNCKVSGLDLDSDGRIKLEDSE